MGVWKSAAVMPVFKNLVTQHWWKTCKHSSSVIESSGNMGG
jgi:hypothetical protein